MKIVKDDLWNSKDTLILVTGNSYITKDSKLVMGRGAAKEAVERFPGIDYSIGKMIKDRDAHLQRYGVLIDKFTTEKLSYQLLGVFQVKYHFKDIADLQLIKYSCDVLSTFVLPWINSVSINFPGIGYGNRTMEEVLPIISHLPDNVTFYIK